MTPLAAFLSDHEAVLRGGIFFGLLLAFALLERVFPRRHQHVSRRHFISNLALGGMNIALVRLILPGGLVALALANQGGGLMGALGFPVWVEFLASLILLDLLLYWHHRAFHAIPLLWRLHSPHHGDRNLNVSSGMRFHPGEALLSAMIKALGVLLIGAPAAAVILFELLLNSASLFNHANWSLGRLDAVISKLIVTPDMHRLHHSRLDAESRRNFGFFLSIWDRLFASYQAEPATAHEHIALGLDTMPDDGFGATLRHPGQP